MSLSSNTPNQPDRRRDTNLKTSPEALSVVFIAGEGRSGSTILDRCIGSVEATSSFNEMHEIVNQYIRNKKRCSCGELPVDCPFWAGVFADETLAENMDFLREMHFQVDGSSRFFRLFFGLYGLKARKQLRRYGQLTAHMYRCIGQRAGAQTIVDSSKNPSRALFLKRYAGLDVHCIHLVRNPAAVAASWKKSKRQNDDVLPVYAVEKSLNRWMLKNMACELIRLAMPYKRVCFEEFTRKPMTSLQDIKSWVPSLTGLSDGFQNERVVRLQSFHSLQGNPDRFSSGDVEIRDENQLPPPKIKLSFLQKLLASRYGYQTS